MKTIIDTTSEFTNYPVFAFHFKPVTVMKIGQDAYMNMVQVHDLIYCPNCFENHKEGA